MNKIKSITLFLIILGLLFFSTKCTSYAQLRESVNISVNYSYPINFIGMPSYETEIRKVFYDKIQPYVSDPQNPTFKLNIVRIGFWEVVPNIIGDEPGWVKEYYCSIEYTLNSPKNVTSKTKYFTRSRKNFIGNNDINPILKYTPYSTYQCCQILALEMSTYLIESSVYNDIDNFLNKGKF